MLQTYLPMFIMFAIALGVAAAMFFIGQLVGKKNPTPEKMMPYECGNDSEGASGVKLDVKFYLTAILFVVFDIEVVFLYPWAVQFNGAGLARLHDDVRIHRCSRDRAHLLLEKGSTRMGEMKTERVRAEVQRRGRTLVR
ncbi:MAG TPA: NADH-quinone oxidoreductase subunit A [Polyangiaceae bacterium]|nr:NADH-quinone oxidoreductase subunit A [Polyangiaceae bacterium]